MKKIMPAILFFLITVSLLYAEEKPFSGSIKVGTEINDINDNTTKVNEYNKEKDKDFFPKLGVDLKYNKDDIFFKISGDYNKVDNQKYELDFDLKRYVIFQGNYDRYYHQLEKDLLSNLWAHAANRDSNGYGVGPTVPLLGPSGTMGAATVYNSDISTIKNYGISYRDFKNKVEFHIPSLKGVTIGFANRIQERDGYAHQTALSHCSSCHILGKDKRIDEKTKEYTPYINAKIGTLSVGYSFAKIDYDANPIETYVPDPSGSPTALPASSFQSPFYNRAQYDYTTGSLPFDKEPESEKTKHNLKIKYDISKDSYVYLNGAITKAKNTSTDGLYDPLNGNYGKEIALDYRSIDLKYHSKLTKNLTLNINAGYKRYDNDDVFVDVIDRTNPASAPGGAITLVQGLINNNPGKYNPDYTFDFTRQSLYNRDEYNLGINLNYRMSSLLSFLLEGDVTKISRDNAHEYEVTEDTTKYASKIQANIKPSSTLTSKIYYKFTKISNPFTYFKAGCAEDFTRLDGSGNPKYYGPAAGLYMWDALYNNIVYDTRKAGMSIEPVTKHEIYADINKNINAKTTVNFFGKIEDSKNDDLKTYEWQKKVYKTGVTFNYLANQKLNFYGGYNFLGEKYESIICASYYDG